jgi:hypothetical protein
MPYLAGVVTGVLLTILAVFVIDHVNAEGKTLASEPQKIVNWNVAEQRAALLTRHDQRGSSRGDTLN